MQDENSVEKDINALHDCVSHLQSSIANNKSSADLISAGDILSSTFAAVEYEQLSMKETLKELLKVEEEEVETLDNIRSETMGAGVAQQIAQISQANRNKNTLEEEIVSLKDNISHVENLEHQLEKRVKASSQHSLNALPKINSTSQTYISISRLKWDYTAPEDVIKGFVIHPKKKDVTPFKINKPNHSQFFITNFLWQQIAIDNDF
ncbi:kinetochore protein Spc24-like [Macrobrachium nipponense]|uniref:kinetochore protein Spc24-like n=1 Tax=Macrobrachium nipponense TaxID=159736 RepID=UPI0030C820F5